MPKTPEEYIAAHKAGKEKTDVVPLYTNFVAEWAMGGWDAYIGANATGDTNFMNAMAHARRPSPRTPTTNRPIRTPCTRRCTTRWRRD
ncbi:hypothetical protein [Bifidobacterium cuniculi]|uniref:hypothetical protein n=1 Tax=Bifidobacterium cuniculi TaxID=1688 RepID=UPI000B061269|nr:hypothetical protein [Bifidobacterium cuniculi]